MPHLLIIDADRKQSRYDLERSLTRVGRLQDNEIVVADETVTRSEHCRVERHRDDRFYLHPGESRNPTLLNGNPIPEPCPLLHGDRIDLGRWTLVYRERDEPAPRLDDLAATPASDMTFMSAEEALKTPIDGVTTMGGRAESAMEIVLEADRQLTLQRPLDDIYKVLLDLAWRVVAFDRGQLMLLEDGEPVRQHVHLREGEGAGDFAVSGEVIKRVVERGEAVLARDVPHDPDLANRGSINGPGILSLMCVPLLRDDKVLGFLYLDSRSTSARFNRESLQVLVHLASVAAVKIENRSLVDRMMETRLVLEDVGRAADIQHHLLPHEAPRIDGYVSVARTTPCFGVGGDWYDWMSAPNDGCGFCLADVAGKGLSAAILMSSAHASLRALCQAELPPHETIGRLNELLEQRFPYNRFVTLWYALLDPVAHALTYVNACQEHPMVRRADGRWHRLDKSGPPVGMLPASGYEASTVALAPGDVILVYSDGVIDCRNAANEPYGFERLLDLITTVGDLPPAEIAESILGAVDEHRGTEPHADDVTLLLLKRLD